MNNYNVNILSALAKLCLFVVVAISCFPATWNWKVSQIFPASYKENMVEILPKAFKDIKLKTNNILDMYLTS